YGCHGSRTSFHRSSTWKFCRLIRTSYPHARQLFCPAWNRDRKVQRQRIGKANTNMKPLFSVLALWSLLAVPVLAQTASWQKVAGSLTSDVPSIVFTSNDTGYMLEQTGSTMTIVKTMNGGQSFSGLPVPAVGTVTGVTNMCWPTANDGFVACATSSGTKLLVTHNAGASWNESTASSSESFNFLSFPTASVGYASGSKIPSGSGYFVAKTTDGGSNWTTVYTNTNTIGSLDFHTAMDGIIFVDDNSQVPQLAYTFDGLESA